MAWSPQVFATGFQDVLDTPAVKSPLAAKSLLNGLAAAGNRLVAVGQRGHIVFSDDRGASWQQATVPVSSDLTAVYFPTPRKGWAVGHDGVVLHSSDGGVSWVRQLDGPMAGKMMESWYVAAAARGALGADREKLLEEVKRQTAQMMETPFLDVWFSDENTGYIVGAFNLIFCTADGGKSWEPWFHLTENPGRQHFYSVRGLGTDVYIAGEQGLVLKLDPGTGRFRKLTTPYQGSWFGLALGKGFVLAFGLRGNAYRSIDGGKNWSRVDTGLQEGLTGATTLADGSLVLVSQSGQVLMSRDTGASFTPVKLPRTAPASAVVAVGNQMLVIAGPRGVSAQALR
ncbi:MAG: YCF48-related protein [Rhodocyclaceae bacterium]|nr:YCF48-related protein [Rhodocyclaceae bacterium]